MLHAPASLVFLSWLPDVLIMQDKACHRIFELDAVDKLLSQHPRQCYESYKRYQWNTPSLCYACKEAKASLPVLIATRETQLCHSRDSQLLTYAMQAHTIVELL